MYIFIKLYILILYIVIYWAALVAPAGKESACNAGDLGSVSGLRGSPGEGKCYPFQYSGLENSMDYSPWGHKESDTTERLSHSLLIYYKPYIQNEYVNNTI